jgi:gluconolactonase
MQPGVTVYDEKVYSFIRKDPELLVLADDCLFTEGPVWNGEGYYLFSDIPANGIYKIGEEKPKELFLAHSGTYNTSDPLLDLERKQYGSNGLAYDEEGSLLVCQHGDHGIARYDRGELTPFISKYAGKPFNSPNDLVLHSDGRIYFSDPPYGLKGGVLNPSKFQPVAGVYCWQYGESILISDRYQYPNGVVLSPDEKVLYICSTKPHEAFVSAYDTKKNRFLNVVAEENSDGIECDQHGNLYLCNKDGIIIVDRDGKRMALLALPKVPANICWGGSGKKDLLITAREEVYLLKGFLK